MERSNRRQSVDTRTLRGGLSMFARSHPKSCKKELTLHLLISVVVWHFLGEGKGKGGSGAVGHMDVVWTIKRKMRRCYELV